MAIYCIDNKNYFNICIDKNTYNVITESNEWLYLIPGGNGKQKAEDMKQHIIAHLQDVVVIHKKILPFMTGTINGLHAFCSIYYILFEYLYNKTKYEKYNIVVYSHLQQGVKDLVQFFIDDILYIDADIIYEFDEVCIIPCKLHSYFENIQIRDQIVFMIQDKILNSSLLTLTKYQIDDTLKNKNMCILKPQGAVGSSPLGCLKKTTIDFFVDKTGYMLVEPVDYNEIQLIQILQQCGTILVLSWGTVFQKNFVYIGDQVLKVIVLMTDRDCIHQYNDLKNRKILFDTFKNANFYYIQVEESKLYNETFYDDLKMTVTISK